MTTILLLIWLFHTSPVRTAHIPPPPTFHVGLHNPSRP
jgi:hypothetical protein